jgi:hypothetical protein
VNARDGDFLGFSFALFCVSGIYFYLRTLEDLILDSLRGPKYYLFSLDQSCKNYKQLLDILGGFIDNDIGKVLKEIDNSGFSADEIVNILKNNLTFEGNGSKEVVGKLCGHIWYNQTEIGKLEGLADLVLVFFENLENRRVINSVTPKVDSLDLNQKALIEILAGSINGALVAKWLLTDKPEAIPFIKWSNLQQIKIYMSI